MLIAKVVFNIAIDRDFDYIYPDSMQLTIGCRVIVPFAKQQKIAIVTALTDTSSLASSKLKTIIEKIDEQPIFEAGIFKLLNWAYAYYQHALGEILFQALPTKLRNGDKLPTTTEIYQLTEQGKQELANPLVLRRSKTQLALLQAVAVKPVFLSNAKSKTLLTKELIEKKITAIHYIDWWQQFTQHNYVNDENKPSLNQEQQTVVDTILSATQQKPWLLYGVTGSGKTEIYLQIIEATLAKRQQVLVLVPEISLTPQLINRFQARFKVNIDIYHSELNDSEKLAVWLQSKHASSAITIATRSGIFLQFKNLGLIVVDEEHDASYKQQSSWCYNARDLAVVRAQQLSIPLILGSATPSLESLHNVEQHKYMQLFLTHKAENDFISAHTVINLKNQRLTGGLAPELLVKIQEHLANNNQVLIFLNKRGFAPVVLCHECGSIATCTNCNKPFTYYQKKRILHCHYCQQKIVVQTQCHKCGSIALTTTGQGTEQLEANLQQLFPQDKVMRIDRENVYKKGQLTKLLKQVTNNEFNILIGTQLLTKGHHFPNLTLVAIIDIDSVFFSFDFKAEERFAQQYIQVAGRAGRANKQGEVVLQTHYPQHNLLNTLLTADYLTFAKQTLALRKLTQLPPFTYQAILKAKHSNENTLKTILTSYQQVIQQVIAEYQLTDFVCIGPMSAPHAKKAKQYRMILLLQHSNRQVLQQVIKRFKLLIEQQKNARTIAWYIDIDPYDYN